MASTDVHTDELKSLSDRFDMATRGLQEVLNPDVLRDLMSSGKPVRLYLGTATSGQPHVGYLGWMIKVADLVAAGIQVVILLADLHAFLDSSKSPWELLGSRCVFYQRVLEATLATLGVKPGTVEFIRGSAFQLTRDYTIDMYRAMSHLSLRDAQKAGTDVVKQSTNPVMSSCMYPALQCLDEVYLNADGELGGEDQRKIMTLSMKLLPALGHTRPRFYLLGRMLPGFSNAGAGGGGKMSSSEDASKIGLLDDETSIRKKINKAYLMRANETCGVMQFIKYIMFPILGRRGVPFRVRRSEKYGGDIAFASYEDFKIACENTETDGSIWIGEPDIKTGLADFIVELLQPVRDVFADEEGVELLRRAYPSS